MVVVSSEPFEKKRPSLIGRQKETEITNGRLLWLFLLSRHTPFLQEVCFFSLLLPADILRLRCAFSLQYPNEWSEIQLAYSVIGQGIVVGQIFPVKGVQCGFNEPPFPRRMVLLAGADMKTPAWLWLPGRADARVCSCAPLCNDGK